MRDFLRYVSTRTAACAPLIAVGLYNERADKVLAFWAIAFFFAFWSAVYFIKAVATRVPSLRRLDSPLTPPQDAPLPVRPALPSETADR